MDKAEAAALVTAYASIAATVAAAASQAMQSVADIANSPGAVQVIKEEKEACRTGNAYGNGLAMGTEVDSDHARSGWF